MKSRITTYVLIVAVVAVWGFVAWKIFSRHTPPGATVHRSVRSDAGNDEEYSLRLDYPDPFLKNVVTMMPKHSDTAPRSAHVDSSPVESSRLPDDLPLKYAGTISAGGVVSYIFEYSGLLHSLSPGKSLEGYILTEVFTDSVRLAKGGTIFTIHIQQ